MKRLQQNKILLHGFRATGKSTVGKLLAEKLAWQFIDLDRYLEQKSGKTIAEITMNGKTWEEMRSLENQALQDVLTLENVVVAVGGGLAVNAYFGEQNLVLIRENTNVLNILFEAQPQIIADRIREHELQSDFDQRPILGLKNALAAEKLSRAEKIEMIVKDSLELLQSRIPAYRKITNFVVETNDDTPQQTLEKIWQKLMQKQN